MKSKSQHRKEAGGNSREMMMNEAQQANELTESVLRTLKRYQDELDALEPLPPPKSEAAVAMGHAEWMRQFDAISEKLERASASALITVPLEVWDALMSIQGRVAYLQGLNLTKKAE